MMTEDRSGLEIPDSFFEKYDFLQGVKNETTGKTYLPLSSTVERKFYDPLAETGVFKDIQDLLKKSTYPEIQIVVILLHECGGITKIEITSESIRGSVPRSWEEVTDIGHDYCYGCSDIKDK